MKYYIVQSAKDNTFFVINSENFIKIHKTPSHFERKCKYKQMIQGKWFISHFNRKSLVIMTLAWKTR